MGHIKDKKVWIIGASSGIGAALAHELSRRGANLILSARRNNELERVSSGLSASTVIAPVDVSDAKGLKKIAQEHGPFDCVIFLAALYNPGLVENMNLDESSLMVDINIKGALNTIDAVYPVMRQAHKGQIVLCGSVAGYCGLPNSQPYSLTKAAIMSLAQSLRIEAEQHNIDIKLISPGFVRTPLTDKNNFDMPMIMEPEEAARIIADGLTASAFEIHFPRRFTWIVKLLSILPYPLFFRITRGILDKKIRKNAS